MFKRRKHADITKLIDEVEQLKLKSQGETPNSHHISLQSDDGVVQELIDSVNGLLDMLQRKYEDLHVKYEIVTDLNEIGTWDLAFENGKPAENNIYNNQFRNALGYQNENDFPNTFGSWYNTIAPEIVETVTSAVEQHFSGQTKKPYDIEYQSINKDGSVEWVHAKAETVRDEHGTPLRNIGTLVNIHTNKMNTIRIEHLLSRLELIEKSLSYSVTTLEGAWGMDLKDSNTQEGWYSPQFKRLLGYEEDEFEPKLDTWMNLIAEEEKENMKNKFHSYLYDNKNATDFEMTFQMKVKNNDYRWFTMLASFIPDEYGNPALVSGVLRDINNEIDRKEYDEKIEREMNEFTHSLSELTENINHISNEAAEIAQVYEVMANAATETNKSIDLTKSAAELIKQISSQTNLLGLNASIEAARAGEHGKGFSVVASEVQNLSSNTSDAVEQIEEILNDINSSVQNIVTSINDMNDKVNSQAAVTEEINSSTEGIHGMSERLLALIQQINRK